MRGRIHDERGGDGVIMVVTAFVGVEREVGQSGTLSPNPYHL